MERGLKKGEMKLKSPADLAGVSLGAEDSIPVSGPPNGQPEHG